ncbi:MAG: pyrroline-5-carboxylate reductase family protein [Solirubrobacterales bacterium]
MRIGFVGSGNIATAMARGWARSPDADHEMLFCDAIAERADALAAEVGGEARDGISAIAIEADAVVLAVKPDNLEEAGDALGDAAVVVSVLAGTPAARVQEALGASVPVLRVLPNVAVEVGAGVCCVAPGIGVDEKRMAELRGALGELGAVVSLDEGLFDPAMAVMSCGPAFLAVVVEAMSAAAEDSGLDAGVAHELLVDTMGGTAALMSERHATAVREAVTSPGGATAAGLAELEAGAVRDAYAAAVGAAVARFRA